MKQIKKQLGFITRGLRGIINNNFENIPEINLGIKSFSIGKSVEDRDIYAYKIGNGSTKVAFGGGIHGNEVGTVKFIKQLINFIYNNQEKYTDYTFYFIPVINPDGFEIGRNNPNYFGGGNVGRFNAYNVDLNKNFPTKSFQKYSVWSRGDNYTESKKIFAGEFGGSEPETQALISFLKDKNIKFFFNYHSCGADVQANQVSPSEEMNKIYAKVAGFNYWTEEQWKKLGQTGTLKEWCEENQIAFSEIENPSRWGSSWDIQEKAIEAVLEFLVSNN